LNKQTTIFYSDLFRKDNLRRRRFYLKTSFFKQVTFVLLLLCCSIKLSAINYYQRQTGVWNNPTTWTTGTGWLSTVNTGTYPQSGDNVYFRNNGNLATITLTSDAACANLSFDGSEPACVIAMDNYNLTVGENWTVDWSSNASFTQSSGYLQINGGITLFRTAKSISNLRIGSASFTFAQTNQITLTVTSNYDYNCYASAIPTGIDATSAVKMNATPCSPTLFATSLPSFGDVCPNSTVGPNSFTLSALAITSANITVAPLTGFTYSTTSNGTYSNSLTLTQGGGHYSQPIYVKFTPVTTTSYNGNIVIGGGGAPNIQVSAVGNGSTIVHPTVTSPTSTDVTTTSATLGGNITIEGCSSNSITERGIYYSTINGFADGAGTKVSETGIFSTGTFSLNVSALSPNTTYYFKAFATNINGTGYSIQGTFNNIPKTYYSFQSGNWTSASSWVTGGCGSLINDGSYPGAVDNVVICQQHTITINLTGLSCNNLNMEIYNANLVLNNDFTINGDFALANQSFVSVGTYNLAIGGNFTNMTSVYNSRIDYTSGNITIGGNITVGKSGYEPFNCTGTGWLIMSGTSKTFTVNDDIIVPRFRQSISGFTKGGNKNLNITTTFDQNCGPAQTNNKFNVTGTTINATCANTITTGTITGSPFCAGATGINVPFTYVPSSNFSSATFTAQLSNSSGSFTSPTALQSIVSNRSGSQTISVTIPSGTTAGTGYRIRVISNTPAVNGSDNGVNLTVVGIPVAVVASAATGISCSQFTANWNAVSGATSYFLDVSTSNTFASFVTGYENLNIGNVTTYNITGFPGGVACYYRVRATNSCGTSASSGTITVNTDTQSPTLMFKNPAIDDLILVVSDQNLSSVSIQFNQFADKSSAPSITRDINPTAADNCSYSVAYVATGATTLSGTGYLNSSQSFNTTGLTTINWTATDPAGNTPATLSQKVIALKKSDFNFTACPGDLTLTTCNPVANDTDFPVTNLSYTIPASLQAQITAGVVSVAVSNTSVLGNENGAGCTHTRVRTYNLTLSFYKGTVATGRLIETVIYTCTQTYTYTVDTVDPAITCIQSVAVVNANTPGCLFTIPNNNTFDAIATDNCSVVSMVHNYSGGGSTLALKTFPVGTTTIIWTATDGCGHVKTFNQTITVNKIDVTVVNSSSDVDDCPDFLVPFNANNDNYDAGTTLVSFTVSRQYSTGDWSFTFNLTGGNVYNDPGNLPSAKFTNPISATTNHFISALSSATVNVNASIDTVILDFYVVNTPGTQQNLTFVISSVNDNRCSGSSKSATHTILPMPVVGKFN
jgi:hypothetical protein